METSELEAACEAASGSAFAPLYCWQGRSLTPPSPPSVPTTYREHLWHAAELQFSRRRGEAEGSYLAALSLAPTKAEPYYRLGRLWLHGASDGGSFGRRSSPS